MVEWCLLRGGRFASDDLRKTEFTPPDPVRTAAPGDDGMPCCCALFELRGEDNVPPPALLGVEVDVGLRKVETTPPVPEAATAAAARSNFKALFCVAPVSFWGLSPASDSAFSSPSSTVSMLGTLWMVDSEKAPLLVERRTCTGTGIFTWTSPSAGPTDMVLPSSAESLALGWSF